MYCFIACLFYCFIPLLLNLNSLNVNDIENLITECKENILDFKREITYK